MQLYSTTWTGHITTQLIAAWIVDFLGSNFKLKKDVLFFFFFDIHIRLAKFKTVSVKSGEGGWSRGLTSVSQGPHLTLTSHGVSINCAINPLLVSRDPQIES